jgi:hypothetical protein
MTWQQILKSYDLEDFIIVKEKKKKKAKGEKKEKGPEKQKVGDGDTAEIDYTPKFKNVVEGLEQWRDALESESNANLRLTGQKGSQNLFEYIERHVKSEVKREGAKNYGKGVHRTINKIISAVSEAKLLDMEDLTDIKKYIKTLERIEETDKLNPRNIPFTVPESVGKDGAESWKTVYGHYRTPEYIKHRKANKKEETLGAALEHWYDDAEDTAEPPFWQALFAKRTRDITGINMGLLPLLKEFVSVVSDSSAPIATANRWHIKGKLQRATIQKSEDFMKALGQVLGLQKCYRDATGTKPFDRLHINFTKTRDELRKKEIKVSSPEESKFIIDYMNKDEFKDDEGNYLVAVGSYFVDSISDRLIRTILTGPQKTIDLDNHPHQGLKGIFLNRPINERKNRKVLWEREQKQAIKDGNLPPWAKDDEPPEGGGSTTKKSEQDILEKIQNTIDILKRELL